MRIGFEKDYRAVEMLIQQE